MKLRRCLSREEGQSFMEYGLILVLVAVAVVAILTLLGPAIGNMYSTIISAWP
ncbi:MAG: pilus assembly protein [Anaerolineae bacterium]